VVGCSKKYERCLLVKKRENTGVSLLWGGLNDLNIERGEEGDISNYFI